MKTKGIQLSSQILLVTTALGFALTMVGGSIAMQNKGVVSSFLGQETQQIIKDPNASKKDKEYFKSSFANLDSERKKAKRYAETIQAEGSVLLRNVERNGKRALPLAKNSKVNLYSASSPNLVYGGFGSSSLESAAASMYDGLTAAGLQVNVELYDWYADHLHEYGRRPTRGSGLSTIFNINEASWNDITTPAKDAPADSAIFVLSRIGGEGIDSTMYAKNGKAIVYGSQCEFDYKDGNYLKLTDEERNVLNQLVTMRNNGVFNSVVVVMNTSNQVEFEWVDDIDVDAILFAGTVGSVGTYAIGDILVGNVNPSGKLPDTYWKNHYLNPVNANFGGLVDKEANPNLTQWRIVRNPADGKHVVYQEGIYSGYRYTETRYEDSILQRANVGEFDYNEVVSYPFGYGESYTTFEYTDLRVNKLGPSEHEGRNDDEYSISVNVTNTGSVAGKEAVQIYLQKPYTEYDIQNQVEKAAVELVAFEKTDILEPGESQVVHTVVKGEQLASYDSHKAKTYIVDEGDYYFTAAHDAHDAINNILAKKGKTVSDKMTANGNAVLTHKIHKDFDDVTYSTSKVKGHENVKITNHFDDTDLNIYDTTGTNHVTYVSRNDWNGTVKFGLTKDNERTFDCVEVVSTEQMKKDLADTWKVLPDESKGGEYPTFGSTSTNYSLVTLRAIDDGDGDPSNDKPIPYDDPMWEDLLNQISWEEMANFLANAGYGNSAITSISKPYVADRDGGNGVVVSYQEVSGLAVRTNDPLKGSNGIIYPSNNIAAATYNPILAEYYGKIWGEDCLWSGVGGLYGVSLDTHRSPYGGRNFEYYSEDPVLGGTIAGLMVRGIASRGAYCYIKHAMLNEQETYRCGNFSWANEQSIREIYLRQFEYGIKLGGNMAGIMTSLNSIGIKWSGCHEFLNKVLRDEFGMMAHVVTDSLGCHNAEFGNGLFYGNDLALGGYGTAKLKAAAPKSEGGTGEYGKYAWAMREATHRALYTIVHGFCMNGYTNTDRVVAITPPWINQLYIGEVCVSTVFAISVVFYAVGLFLRRKELFQGGK